MRDWWVILALTLCTACGSAPENDVDPGIHAWPLLHVEQTDERGEIDVLWPLFHREEEGEVVEVDVVWPLINVRSSPEGNALNVRPLVWHESHETGENTVVFPVYWSGHEGEDQSWFHVWPVYGNTRDGTHERDWYAFPLLRTGSDPARDLREWDLAWPLFHYSTSADQTSVRALPLVWHTFSNDARATVVFPFWWDIEDSNGSFFMALPFYGRQTAEGFDRRFIGGPLWIDTTDGDRHSTDVMWPIYHHGTAPGRSDFRLWPLFGRSTSPAKTKTSVAWPFFSYTEYENDGWELDLPAPLLMLRRGNGHDSTTVFPLFGLSHDQREERDQTDWWIAGPLVTGSDRPGHSDFRILWKLVERTVTEDTSVFAINPLYRSETRANGDSSLSILLGLYAHAVRNGEKSYRILWFLRF